MSPQQLQIYLNPSPDREGSWSKPTTPWGRQNGEQATNFQRKGHKKRVTFTEKMEVKTSGGGVVTKRKKVSQISLPPIGPRSRSSSQNPPIKNERKAEVPKKSILKQRPLLKDNPNTSGSREEGVICSPNSDDHADEEETISVDPCVCEPSVTNVQTGQQCPVCGGWKWTDHHDGEDSISETVSQEEVPFDNDPRNSHLRLPSPPLSDYDFERDSLLYNRFGLQGSPVLSEDLEHDHRHRTDGLISKTSTDHHETSGNGPNVYPNYKTNTKKPPSLPAIQNDSQSRINTLQTMTRPTYKWQEKLSKTIHRDAYVECLSIARATQLPREPWLLATKTTPTVGFSYFSTKSTTKSGEPTGRCSNNPMKTIFGGVSIDGYYDKQKKDREKETMHNIQNVVSHMSKLEEGGEL